MKIRCSTVVFLLLALPGLLLAAAPSLFEHVTLQKVDGWTYTDVSVRVAEDGNSVLVEREDGATILIFTDYVGMIVDAQGKEITTQVIPSYDHRYNEFEVEPVSHSIGRSGSGTMPLPPKLFNVMFSGGVGYGKPAGGFYDRLESGLLYYGDVRFSISPLMYVKGAYRSEKMYDKTGPAYDNMTGEYIGDANLSVVARQYLVTFGFLSRPKSKTSIRSYAELGAGMVDHVATAELASWSDSVHEKRLLFAGEAGMFIPVHKQVGLDCGVSVLAKFFENNDGEGNGFMFAAHVGVTLSLGAKN